MAVQLIHGEIENLTILSETSGTAGGRSHFSQNTVRTKHIAHFRISGRPVKLDQSGNVNLSDGDKAVCAGPIKKGTMKAYAIRNETTGITRKAPVFVCSLLVTIFLIGGIVLIWTVIGSPIGIFVIGVALFIAGMIPGMMKSNSMLAAHVRRPAAVGRAE